MPGRHLFGEAYQVVPGRLELPTSTLSVWRSNQLSYRTVRRLPGRCLCLTRVSRVYLHRQPERVQEAGNANLPSSLPILSVIRNLSGHTSLQKGGVPAAPSGTATLLRLSPNHQFHLRPPLAVTDFRCPRLSWLDGRCVQGPGTYSPRHG